MSDSMLCSKRGMHVSWSAHFSFILFFAIDSYYCMEDLSALNFNFRWFRELHFFLLFFNLVQNLLKCISYFSLWKFPFTNAIKTIFWGVNLKNKSFFLHMDMAAYVLRAFNEEQFG